jgi:hypothetical protein
MSDHLERDLAEPHGAAEPDAASEAPASSGVSPDQPGAPGGGAAPGPEPVGERSGGAGSAGGQVLESPGGPSTVNQDGGPATLGEELVQASKQAVGELSPDMGTTRAEPAAGGSRFDELVAKRASKGLADEEAEELGRLMAQRDGREWTSTRQLRLHPDDTP